MWTKKLAFYGELNTQNFSFLLNKGYFSKKHRVTGGYVV